jgi:hypothetical protein
MNKCKKKDYCVFKTEDKKCSRDFGHFDCEYEEKKDII